MQTIITVQDNEIIITTPNKKMRTDILNYALNLVTKDTDYFPTRCIIETVYPVPATPMPDAGPAMPDAVAELEGF